MDKVNQQLLDLGADNEEYAKFNKKIVNTNKQVIGVRLPALRKLAREISKGMTFDDVAIFIDSIDCNIYEHVLLAGLIINYSHLTDVEMILLTRKYLPLVDSWALIDSFVVTKHRIDNDAFWDFSLECLGSNQEFTVRYGVIQLMTNYLNDKKIDSVFRELRRIHCDDYYVKMALAWLYATAAVNFYRQTLDEIVRPEIDNWTRKKAFQKMIESFRLNDHQKTEIRALRNVLKP